MFCLHSHVVESEAKESNSMDSMGFFIFEDDENKSHNTGGESEQAQPPATNGQHNNRLFTPHCPDLSNRMDKVSPCQEGLKVRHVMFLCHFWYWICVGLQQTEPLSGLCQT